MARPATPQMMKVILHPNAAPRMLEVRKLTAIPMSPPRPWYPMYRPLFSSLTNAMWAYPHGW